MALWAAAGRKVFFILLLLCATGLAQTPEFDPLEGHTHQSRHCCGLCHVGALPALESSPCLFHAPLAPVGWLEAAANAASAHDRPVSFRSSRAPPA